MNQRQRLLSRTGIVWALVGFAIGVGVYRGSKAAFSRLDGLTNTSATNAAAGTTFLVLLAFVVTAALWTRHAGQPGSQ